MKSIYIVVLTLLISCKPKEVKEVIVETPEIEVNNNSWEAKTWEHGDGPDLNYNILYPIRKVPGVKYPLLVFLHGAGERGNDNESQRIHIAPFLSSDSIRNHYPAYVVFPQCPADERWSEVEVSDGKWMAKKGGGMSRPLKQVSALIDHLMATEEVDKNRLYISGLSMGGYGTFAFLGEKGDAVAGAIAICGGGDVDAVTRYAHVPIKIFHGAKDPVVPVAYSQELHKALVAAHAPDVQYIEFPEGGHGVWNESYDHPGLLKWLFAQSRK